MSSNNRLRGIGRGDLIRNFLADSNSNSDESRDLANITASSSGDTSLEGIKDVNGHNESGYKTNSTQLNLNDVSLPSTSTNVRSISNREILERLARARNEISHDIFQVASAAKPVGTGRGQIIKLISESDNNSANDKPVENRFNQNVVDIDKGILDLTLLSNDEEPVIKTGTKGRPIEIMTNYMKLNFDPSKGVFEYEVRFDPDVHSSNMRQKLLNQQKSVIGNVKTFDGVTLYLPIKLLQNVTELTSTSPNDTTSYLVTIIFKRKKKMSECIHLYNVLFDKVMRLLQYIRFGQKRFDPTAPKIIPHHRLEIWPGYVTAVDEYEDGVMLNLDVSHRLLCQNTVLDILSHIYRSDKENLHQIALTALLGNVILTRYNNKTYRIDDIQWNSSPKDTFVMNGRDVSYMEYYKTHYGIELRDENQPLLISRVERRVAGQAEKETLTFCLIPEISYLTGITDEMRSDQKVMRDIATETRVTPEQRMNAYRKFCENIKNSPEATEILQNWGLSLDSGPRKVMGRQLDNEVITFGQGKKGVAEKGDFGKYSCNNPMLKVVDLNNWLIIYTKRDERATRSFIEVMERNAGPMGIDVSAPKVECLYDDKTESYVKLLRKCINSTTQIIVIICPTSRDDRYAAIKKICCTELPIPTQVINSRTLANETKNRAIVQKIALQMNCKMGGSLWSINIPLKNVMICGIDTYHDSVKKQNSVSAFIASLNGTFTQWFSQATIQSKKEELLNGLCKSLTTALIAYKKVNEVYPEKIIVFRDGVGDGQLNMINEYEIPQMKLACSYIEENYNPGFTFIVVRKRIITRLFAITGGKLANPLPGCVVDHTITRCYLFDFFLVPQNVRQGTVSPTHYIVVHDTSNYSPDIIQRLSYKLCFLYYNWPGTVRVPACCQYAHKLATLVGQSIKRQPSEVLSDKLYYL